MFDHDIFLIVKCLGHRCNFESIHFIDLAKKSIQFPYIIIALTFVDI